MPRHQAQCWWYIILLFTFFGKLFKMADLLPQLKHTFMSTDLPTLDKPLANLTQTDLDVFIDSACRAIANTDSEHALQALKSALTGKKK